MRAPPGPPMTLANMRQNGVRSVIASCANCGRSADVNVDLLLEVLVQFGHCPMLARIRRV
jgi:hypothetical protein